MDLDRLRKHYASLSDEALLDIERGDLVAAACEVLDAEIAARNLDEPTEDVGMIDYEVQGRVYEENWAADSVTVFAYTGQDGEDGDHAIAALKAAGIPYELNQLQEPGQPTQMEISIPVRAWLEATSLLDRDVFNIHHEQMFRDNLAKFSDEELAATDIEVLMAGWTDRIERCTRAYREERAKRAS